MNPFLAPPEPEKPSRDQYQSTHHVYEGVCHGGPMDGREAASRGPKGFLLVAKWCNKCWLYDYDSTTRTFKVRSEEGEELISDPDSPKNRYRAAGESEFDVLAAPWGGDDGNPSA